MRTQGWPANLIKWVNSSLLDRTVKIRLDGQISDTFQILNGVPQGSPTSPILFLLYIEPALRLSKGRFGYADDILKLETARTLNECGQKLQLSLNYRLQWGLENRVQSETSKIEPQFFHIKRMFMEPHIQMENKIIQQNEFTRCLGIVYDRKLTFKEQARKACQCFRVVTDHVKRPNNMIRGTQPSLLRQAIQGAAFVTLFYGA